MKKSTLFFRRIFLWAVPGLLLSGFSSASYAQRVFYPGLVAGINASQISGDTYGGFNQPGLYLGPSLSVMLSEKAALRLEMAFSQKGSRKNPDTENGDFNEYRLRLNYIEVPLMLRVAQKGLAGELGVALGYRIGDHWERNQFGDVMPQRAFRREEYSVLVGVSYHFAQHFSAGVRLTNSLLPVRKHPSGTSFRWNGGQYNSVLTFLVTYRFGKDDERARPSFH